MTTLTKSLSSPKPAKRKRSFWRNIRPYYYLLPAFIIMGIITYYPMLYQIWMSFTNYGLPNLRVGSPWPAFVGLSNYINILTNQLGLSYFNFWHILAFDLFWTFSNVIIHVSLGILIAVILNRQGVWFKGIYRALFILPIILPQIIIANIFKNMFDPDYGAINQGMAILGKLVGLSPNLFHIHWIDQVAYPISWLPLPLSYFALLITNIWLGWPFMTIVASGALQSIPKDLYEASTMDGATGSQQFWRITLPLLRPAMVPAAVYGIVQTFNLFSLIYFLSGGGPLNETAILVTAAYNLINQQHVYGVAAAFCVYIFIILLALTLLTNTLTRATESYDV
ncbi:MAG: sugar ABC transporter permease [Anaerolineales bacterium]|jgi:arabinogalactan oligomer/maltooligosaccharide transport system permease protein